MLVSYTGNIEDMHEKGLRMLMRNLSFSAFIAFDFYRDAHGGNILLRLGPHGVSQAKVLLVDFSRSQRLPRLRGEDYWSRGQIRAEAAAAMRAIDVVAIARHIVITVVGADACVAERQYYDLVNCDETLELRMPVVRKKSAEWLLRFLRLKQAAAAEVAASAVRCRGACVALHLLIAHSGSVTLMAEVSS
jgi:hypothetical protein